MQDAITLTPLGQAMLAHAEAVAVIKKCLPLLWEQASEVVDRQRVLKTEGPERELWLQAADIVEPNITLHPVRAVPSKTGARVRKVRP